MKLMTFNVQHFRDYNTKEINFDLFSKLIKRENPDIIALNEVFGENDNTFFKDQVKFLSKLVNMNYFFGKAITIDRGIYGNAILSKYDINNPCVYEIPDPLIKDEQVYYESRIIIKCNINNLNVLVTHLGLANQERINGVNKLLEIIKDIKNPFVIMGDFNMKSNDLLLSKLLDYTIDPFKESDFTFPSYDPMERIDYILLSKNLKYKNNKVIKEVVSDHFPLSIITNDIII